MRLRLFVAYALFLAVSAPLLDHHAVERVPWHGHLFAQSAPAEATHLHLAQYPHDDSVTGPAPGDVILLGQGSGLLVSSITVATPSLCTPWGAGLSAAPLRPVQGAGELLRPDGTHPALPDPPPRLLTQQSA